MALHALLLLSDSALPLGSFAFSSGLESHIAHAKLSGNKPSIPSFLHSSIQNTCSTALPFAIATFRRPALLVSADDVFDASTPCTVARRASIAQGRALGTLWTKALRPATESEATQAVDGFVAALKDGGVCAHLPPLWGAVCNAAGLDEWHAAYVLVLGQAKAVVSAAVRAGTIGPYAGQALLASEEVKGWIEGCVRTELARIGTGEVDLAAAGIAVPAVDLWMGRHELLYSRIFNS